MQQVWGEISNSALDLFDFLSFFLSFFFFFLLCRVACRILVP